MTDIVLVAKALADSTRVRLFALVSSRGPVCCGDLAKALDVTQATVTHHLRVLAGVKLIETRRDGSFIRVNTCHQGVEACQAAISALLASPPTATDSTGHGPDSSPDHHPSPAGPSRSDADSVRASVTEGAS